jgi:hydroxyacylglutathione hydrolase
MRIDGMQKDRPVAAICGSGYRSSVSVSLLQRHGFRHVVNVLGGMSAWNKAGLGTVKEGDGARA